MIGPVYTSCDLPCDAGQGHSLAILPGEFEGCEFAAREWVVATVDDRAAFWPRAGSVIDQYLFVTGDVRSQDPSITPENTNVKDNIVVRGPYTAQDPEAAQGTSASGRVNYPTPSGLTDDETSPRVYDDEIALAIINKDSGVPIEVMHLGSNYHAENSWAVHANRVSSSGVLKVALGGKFTGTISVQTETCTDSANALASTTCTANQGGFLTTLAVDVNPDLDLDSLPDSATADMGGMTTFVMSLDMQETTGSSMLRSVRWAARYVDKASFGSC